ESNPDLLPVHYDWPLTPDQSEEGNTHRETLKAAARSITHLGWGVDQAVGDADLLADDPPADPAAERWLRSGGGGTTPLRVPRARRLGPPRRRPGVRRLAVRPHRRVRSRARVRRQAADRRVRRRPVPVPPAADHQPRPEPRRVGPPGADRRPARVRGPNRLG